MWADPLRGRDSTWSPEDLQKALEALRNKYGLNEVSRLYGIPKPTLKRHLDGKNKFANGNVVQRGRMTVLPAELENELVSHINQLEGMLFGLTRNDIRCLAYQIAEKKMACLTNLIKQKEWQEKTGLDILRNVTI
ncbi:tigger transposable element-derived protein 6 [Biomphalaria glabrata]